ncbi:FRG domain-containing protein [Pseudomonas sp.]|uniref:FRG domain-containing protein n=1 Tax=Pseudomonas sp. TaxID=306 RepID=UPI003BB77A1A
MARTPRWTNGQFSAGVKEINLSSWKYFSDYVNQELLTYKNYVYRGHASSDWKLEPTLDRIIKKPTSPKRKEHLENFMYSARGRRGSNPPKLYSENDWWALGQHQGLYTPLLDWTESPFVALFFAMANAQQEHSKKCSVFALFQKSVEIYSQNIINDPNTQEIQGRKPITEIIRPLTNENSRLVNQRGLFTRSPNNIDLEAWINSNHAKENPDQQWWHLMKINIPKTGHNDCLKYLNRMNINHATLFPDLEGASRFCNMELGITGY